MKNSIKLLLFWLFTPLFLGVSFADNISYDFIWSITCNKSENNCRPGVVNSSYPYFDISLLSSSDYICLNVYSDSTASNLTYNNISIYPVVSNNWSISSNWSFTFYNKIPVYTKWYRNTYCFSAYMFKNNYSGPWWSVVGVFPYVSFTDSLPDNFFVSAYITNFNSVPIQDCSQNPNYLQCLDRVNTLNWQVWTLSWSLQTCQSDLASCTNSCDTLVSQCLDEKGTLQTTLSGCVEDKNSLQNYNDSLSQQLNECLESWTWWTWWTYIALYDLFWSSDWNDYSLPITNNIHLPYWYRWFLDDWVLAIKQINSLNTAYSISDDDFENKVIWSFSTIFLFLISSWLFLVFLFAIRRYFIWLKSFK